jgi:sulfate adenylyltransferase subunit 2
VTEVTPVKPGDSGRDADGALPHRRRHHLHRAGRVDADSVAKIIAETAVTTITERGATRLDDQTSDASMEQRKKEGYF